MLARRIALATRKGVLVRKSSFRNNKSKKNVKGKKKKIVKINLSTSSPIPSGRVWMKTEGK